MIVTPSIVLRPPRRLVGRALIPARLVPVALVAAFSVTVDAQTGDCDVGAITDRIWDQPSCPAGSCRTLLLRSDGTYQISMIGTSGVSPPYCESGQWRQEPGSCAIRLESCEGRESTRPWKSGGGTLTFGKSSYGVSDQKESTAFTGCTVRRLCDGLSCGEYDRRFRVA